MKVAKADCGIRFRLRDPKSTSSSPIVCFVEYDGKPVIKIATGLKIIPSKWNAEKEKPVTGMKGLSNEDANIYLDRLSNIRSLVDKQYRTYINLHDRFPDKGSFKKTIINELLGIEEGPEVKDPSLINFIDQQIKRTKTGIRVKLSGTGKGQSFSGASVLSYQGTKNFLIAYLGERKRKGLIFDEVTQEFYWDLQDYFFSDRKLSLNYFGKVIKHIKSFMREAEELGYHNNEIYKSKRFLKPQEETDAIYLNVEQLKLIQDSLEQFHPSNRTEISYDDFYKNYGYEYFLQGDVILDIRTAHWNKDEKLYDKVYLDGLVLSNTCDISFGNTRNINPKQCLFAPLLDLDDYLSDLLEGGYTAQKVEEFRKNVKSQLYSNLFYLPRLNDGDKERIALLDRIFWYPIDEFQPLVETINDERVSSLNQYGFYLLVFKLSYHFCRLPEQCDREA